MENRPWARSMANASSRCRDKNGPAYPRYGGRGIKFFLTEDQVKFLWFRDRASEQNRPSIDRIDSNGHYSVSNCRFIEHRENSGRHNREKTRCLRGHPFTGDNLRVSKNYRYCVACDHLPERAAQRREASERIEAERRLIATAYGFRYDDAKAVPLAVRRYLISRLAIDAAIRASKPKKARGGSK